MGKGIVLLGLNYTMYFLRTEGEERDVSVKVSSKFSSLVPEIYREKSSIFNLIFSMCACKMVIDTIHDSVSQGHAVFCEELTS